MKVKVEPKDKQKKGDEDDEDEKKDNIGINPNMPIEEFKRIEDEILNSKKFNDELKEWNEDIVLLPLKAEK